ncbi:amidase signature domain-containing protein [Aspergillus stella-maris]|uniref:amidase signature domain-containing protein n=1 Tax=Aspergillus stella-maris TaxID=1810926 RepID=UPI003CCD2846
MSWQTAAQEIREALDSAIPEKWKLAPEHKDGLQDAMGVPESCGLLTQDQLFVTGLDASRVVEGLASGKLSSAQVTDAFCARAAIAHQLVNCLTVFFPEKALERARELDEHLERTGKPVGPLHGLPIALKDTYDIPGYATTWGYAANASHRAERESATVTTLREAGAVLFCKTTMPQAGMLLETVSNLFGRTLNPRDLDFGAGGSSGGDGVLVALRGSPVTPSTDIGGSIRAPAAFNGLYGIRPTADRVPKRGMKSVESGQLNIRVSCGPVAHSLADVKLLTRVLIDWPQTRYDPTCIPVTWREVSITDKKLSFGIWDFDGVVMPHPPICRAMRETTTRLRAAGHEVIEFKIPFDCWEASRVYMDTYYQCGKQDCLDLLNKAGEPIMPAYKKMLETWKVPDGPIDAKALLKARLPSIIWTFIQAQSKYKEALADAWEATTSQASTGRPIDGLICPASPMAGYPHDFLPWWGYTTLFNLVDYPSTILPIKNFKISETDDPIDTAYNAQDNQFDRECQEVYDPVRWSNMPVCLQVVGRPFDDEELIAVTEVVDQVVNNQG